MAHTCYNKEIRKFIFGRLLLGDWRFTWRPDSSGSWPVSQPVGWDLLNYLMADICIQKKRPWRKTETCTSGAYIPVKTSSLFHSSVKLFDFILYIHFQHFVQFYNFVSFKTGYIDIWLKAIEHLIETKDSLPSACPLISSFILIILISMACASYH
jgi:hypothetical protein